MNIYVVRAQSYFNKQRDLLDNLTSILLSNKIEKMEKEELENLIYYMQNFHNEFYLYYKEFIHCFSQDIPQSEQYLMEELDVYIHKACQLISHTIQSLTAFLSSYYKKVPHSLIFPTQSVYHQEEQSFISLKY